MGSVGGLRVTLARPMLWRSSIIWLARTCGSPNPEASAKCHPVSSPALPAAPERRSLTGLPLPLVVCGGFFQPFGRYGRAKPATSRRSERWNVWAVPGCSVSLRAYPDTGPERWRRASLPAVEGGSLPPGANGETAPPLALTLRALSSARKGAGLASRQNVTTVFFGTHPLYQSGRKQWA